jgi:4,5-dihydroxyphthalate decarboxylase
MEAQSMSITSISPERQLIRSTKQSDQAEVIMRLRTLLDDYPHTAALKDGIVKSNTIEFEFANFLPTNKGFKPMVREQAFDVSEMAILTYLMAKSFGKPMVLLPLAVMARFQHAFAIYNADLGDLKPSDLSGKRVGIRSFTTSTGAWLRGILANDYNLILDAVEWITFEDPHVAEFRDTTTRAPEGKTIIQMLLDGEIDAAFGETSDDPRVRPLFSDAIAEQNVWFARHNIMPINHMVVVDSELAQKHPEAIREIFRLFAESRMAAGDASAHGCSLDEEAMVRSLNMIIRFAAQQNLIPRPFSVDELLQDARRILR